MLAWDATSNVGTIDAFIQGSGSKATLVVGASQSIPHFHYLSTALQPVATLSTITAFEATDATQGAWDECT
jgi:hypothetical protein